MRISLPALIVCMALGCALVDAAEPGRETLGFDVAKVQPPDAAKGPPVARLFDQYIYTDDLKASSAKLTEDEGRRLTAKIFGGLRQRYIQQHKITATADEVRQFADAMEHFGSAIPEKADEPEEKRLQRWERIGEQMVKSWKLDQALYRKHGGTVIFQQGNPMEPVGAYRAFLEEMEKAKVFEVYDGDNRERFWHYFVREHPFQLPPENIHFDKPWWLQDE